MIGRSPFRNRRNQRGDTIVEVMIVLTVLGLAISIAFATANRSLLAARQAQENTQASVLLQAQLEKLRAMAPRPVFAPGPLHDNTNVFQATGQYCIHAARPAAVPNTGPYSILGLTSAAEIAANSARCQQDGAGTPSCTTEPCYDIRIKYTADADGDGVNDDTFTLQAEWNDVTGQQRDRVTLVYRIHQP